MLVAGLVVRLLPLFDAQRTIATISEDGYLMLTVARNIARGLGMSTAAGTIPTNGVQPLVTFGWAGVHWLTDANRLPTLRAVLVLQLAVAMLATVCVWLLARRSFADHPWRDWLTPTAAALWFASPIVVTHTTNGLETGPYVLGIAGVLLIDAQLPRYDVWWRSLVLGVLLGVLFLARNDAAFLILSFLVVELIPNQPPPRAIGARLLSCALIAVSAFAVALPWLIYNIVGFGHIVPISGRAQNLNALVGENVWALPRMLLEYLWMVTPLPAFLGEAPWAGIGVFALVPISYVTIRFRHALNLRFERSSVVLAMFVGLLAVYYGLFFGAAYFLSRYLFPLSLLTAGLPCAWLAVLARRRPRLAAATASLALVIMLVALQRQYARGARHPHAQVAEWVASNVTDGTWVGAPQSGLLGYFHDRTINLDGKLNPRALEARRDERLFHYIVDDTPIEYIADWHGLARWIDQPETVREERDPGLLTRRFEVVVKDRARNLVVLRRVASNTAGERHDLLKHQSAASRPRKEPPFRPAVFGR
jgi:hypothetical protein